MPESISTDRSSRTAVAKVICILFVLAFVAGCGGSATVSVNESQDRTAAATVELPTAPSAAESPEISDPMQRSFSELSSSIPGQVGVAIADRDGVHAFGSWSSGPAWSTIKVPLAIAALRHASGEPPLSLVALAIEDSDNAAAEELWAQLGDPQQAADAVGAVLKDGDDTSTAVESEKKRPGFTAFGQTEWSLSNQAVFMSKLPCLDSSEEVLNYMHHLAGNQQWGLVSRSDVAGKGGWGPSIEGSYLVRQTVTLNTDSGVLGIALSVLPNDGTFDTGKRQIGELAEWAMEHLGNFRGTQCKS